MGDRGREELFLYTRVQAQVVNRLRVEHLVGFCPQKHNALAGFDFAQYGQTFTEFMKAKHKGHNHRHELIFSNGFAEFPLLVVFFLKCGPTLHCYTSFTSVGRTLRSDTLIKVVTLLHLRTGMIWMTFSS